MEFFEDDDPLSDLVVEQGGSLSGGLDFPNLPDAIPTAVDISIDPSVALSFHKECTKSIRNLFDSRSIPIQANKIIQKHEYEFLSPLKEVEDAYDKLISILSAKIIQREIERKYKEIFPSENIKDSKKEFCKVKIYFENISSFSKITLSTWPIFESRLKEFRKIPETANIEEIIKTKILNKINLLDQSTEKFLSKLKTHYQCEIIESEKTTSSNLVSNIAYKLDKDYNISNLFNVQVKEKIQPVEKIIIFEKPEIPSVKNERKLSFRTRVVGTKEWNKNDSYVLEVEQSELTKEYEKFDYSSFVSLKPGEFDTPPTLASAMVRKNSGHTQRARYEQVIKALFDFITTNLGEKDFPKATDEPHVFLYHIGPVVIYNIILEDMSRRNFGHIYCVEKNSLSKIFPENIVKYLIIRYWNEKYLDISDSLVDSYIHFSKGVQFVRAYYKNLYDQGASTRKGLIGESLDIDSYMKENAGKFFGYRRIQVFRRFVSNSIFGELLENSTIKKI
ncbi:MAG: hypothetical protein L6Q54_01880 [Leptospiraceae bacterium]|nr:hypothetical protein [Leptospiraceae bacterium]MCK6379988.1 hypothetical protein [Leptospiraceae bacterium]NUM40169.1 hypothetical protein [Leptospiraceae bacterium]